MFKPYSKPVSPLQLPHPEPVSSPSLAFIYPSFTLLPLSHFLFLFLYLTLPYLTLPYLTLPSAVLSLASYPFTLLLTPTFLPFSFPSFALPSPFPCLPLQFSHPLVVSSSHCLYLFSHRIIIQSLSLTLPYFPCPYSCILAL
jgi:hypothetical protein